MEDQSCRNCFYAKKIFKMTDVLCQYHGIVDRNSVCKRYQYNHFEKKPPKKRELKQFDENHFNIDTVKEK